MNTTWLCTVTLEEKEDCTKVSSEVEHVATHSEILTPCIFNKIYTALQKRYDLNGYEQRKLKLITRIEMKPPHP